MEANRSGMRWTYSEYARLPTSGSTRYEVIGGKVAVTPSPTGLHQKVVGDLLFSLSLFVRKHKLGLLLPGPVDVLFGEGDYLQPDLVFLAADRQHLLSDRGIEGPPNLVVEVLSPSTADRDRGIKLQRYRLFRVPEYWIVDPGARSVEVWRLGEGAEAPEVLEPDDALRWIPVSDGPVFEATVTELLPED